MKLKNFLAKILAFIASIWQKATDEVKILTPIAVKIVNAIKTVNESTVGDVIEIIIEAVIPGNAEGPIIDAVRDKLKVLLPKILKQLQVSNAIANIADHNEQLRAIIASINLSPDETRDMYYHGLCGLILKDLADGKLTLAESFDIGQYYYLNIYKK